MIDALDSVFRFSGVGVLVLGVLVLSRGGGRSTTAWLIAVFAVCVTAYLLYSSSRMQPLLGVFDVPLRALAIAAPAVFFVAALSMFTDGFTIRPWHALPLFVIEVSAFAAVAVANESPTTAYALAYIHQAVVLILFAGAIACAAAGFSADLIESRRRFRLWFVGGAAVLGISIALTELLLRGGSVPGWLELLKVAAIAALSMWLLAWSIEVRPMWFAAVAPAPAATADVPAPERQVLAAVRAAMEVEKSYRKEGLTIGALASQMKVPEHLLRKVINQRLGYRNFNAFLNHYRIREVKAALADPAKARLPVLTLALDAGYGSIGPFNRAFKDAVGMTPTQFRQSPPLAESENPAPIPESAINRQT